MRDTFVTRIELAGGLAVAGLMGACALSGASPMTSDRPLRRVAAAPPASRTFRIQYMAQMDVPADARLARLWMPLPPSDGHQEVSGLRPESDDPYSIHTDPTYGNRVLCVERAGREEEPIKVVLHAVVRRHAYRVLPSHGTQGMGQRSQEDLALFLRPDALVPVSGRIAAEADSVVSAGMSNLEMARAMYDHLTRTFSYDKSVPGYGRGDAVYACDVRRGNCTDVHSLFLGMARSRGIPARFLMGFPLPTDRKGGPVSGYHCWGEFYAADIGWVPIDISEAIKNVARREELFGGLDANRIHFTTGRDIVLCEGAVPGPQNYLIYPVGMADEKPCEVHWEFHFEDL